MSKFKTRKYKKMRASTKRRSRTRKPRTRRSRRGGFDTPPPPRKRPIEIPDAPRRVRVRVVQEEEPQQQRPVNLFGAQENLNPVLDEAGYTTPVRSPNTQHNQTMSPVEHVHFKLPRV